MELCVKYKPELLSELECEYPKIIEYLNSNKTFIVNGSKSCGKSTIVKLYLKLLNYDYLLLDDFSLTKEQIYDKIKFKTKSVFSYFNNKKYTVLIDNFDLFDNSVKDYIINNSIKCQYVIITNKYINSTLNYVYINKYSNDYIADIYYYIYYIETGNYTYCYLPEFETIKQMFSILEFNIINFRKNNLVNDTNTTTNETYKTYETNESNDINETNNYKIFFDKFDFELNDIVKEKNFGKKLYIIDKINAYSILHHNIAYNYNSIHDLANSYEYLSSSLLFLQNNNYCNINSHNLEYYSILSVIGTTQSLDNFKVYKENFQIRKKKKFKYY